MSYLDGICQYSFSCGLCYFVAFALGCGYQFGLVAIGQFLASVVAMAFINQDRK